ncbi:hypothetical protein NEUTE1DRAFT_102082 [Neurospora tetrasperma FGSC 2508]|uniref:Uncharacterized protein n=1 Tax=Neurospora tetrasperma (strain FGSC 2508 / ATCC MYA-4615 / P0657) TaxID=510951 RepID=F8MR39_NEUT8|nr:uncharacterized protein NEUTE1DRAFT_102082 [Neurospora tetrasperma FGSC 2508]EGO56819.1 hypothetical protein NEUTE1DRAFT_102082 [Neurospora tetrasperma FGSC 2508]EGZ70291.1 hypothetical protein NEUTE2DRAFT_130297 [Neurospora tetrasperma FGSC 2509]
MPLVVLIWPSVLDDRPLELEDRMENPDYLQYLYYTQTWTLHEGPKFSLATLRNSLTTTMRYIAAKGLLETGIRSKRTYCNDVGLPELRMLIDHDILHTGSQEVAEVHHLAWALGRICALRPGSLGWSHPSMRDDGMGILKHYSTIDELLDGDRRNIIIKERYLDDPKPGHWKDTTSIRYGRWTFTAIALGEEENQDRMATREAELALNVLRNDEASAVFGPLLNEHNHEQNHGIRRIIPTTANARGASKL